ncbi:hypothetical protein N9Z27_00380 [Alphaproteobacteria bacterium]|nr:hypothetical protein [Alphaproteobacteria bacterium]
MPKLSVNSWSLKKEGPGGKYYVVLADGVQLSLSEVFSMKHPRKEHIIRAIKTNSIATAQLTKEAN